jgi:guanine deaminase
MPTLHIKKCNMDRNSPDAYIEPSVEASITATKTLISHIRTLTSTYHTPSSVASLPLVHPILTPRFAISCTSSLLTSLGDLATSDPSLRIQTHISENPSEILFTKSLFPECTSYAGVYDSFGLLRSNSILAHAVHLEEEEMELIAKRKAGVSHCPTSNFNLSSGVARVGELLDRGIKVRGFPLVKQYRYIDVTLRRLGWERTSQAGSLPRSSTASKLQALPPR